MKIPTRKGRALMQMNRVVPQTKRGNTIEGLWGLVNRLHLTTVTLKYLSLRTMLIYGL